MKILIVDDDSLMRIALKTLIHWEEHGLTLVGEAADGLEALDLIRREKPDILLLDIKMPGMDGIGLLEELSGSPDLPRTVILSSYDEFDLVRQAMRLGAEDYLLKMDLDFDKLSAMLERMTESIRAERQKPPGPLSGASDQKSLRLLRGEFYKTLVGRYYTSAGEMQEEARALGIDLGGDAGFCFLIRCEQADSAGARVLPYAVINVAEEIASGPLASFCYERERDVFCMFSRPVGPAPLQRDELLSCGRRLVEMLGEYLNLTATVGIGEGPGGPKGMQCAYDRACRALENRFHMGADRVIDWSAVGDAPPPKTDYSILLQKEALQRALSGRDARALEGYFEELEARVQDPAADAEMAVALVQQVYYLVWEFCEAGSIPVDALLENSLQPIGKPFSFASSGETVRYLQRLRADLLGWVQGQKPGGSLEMALGYIAEHFHEDISLGKVAAAVGFHPAYLSSLIKRETGLGYSEYLIAVRMHRAKELMATTSYKVYEIGEMVGYPNAFYFARIFKREEGVPPGEYMAGLKKETATEGDEQ